MQTNLLKEYQTTIDRDARGFPTVTYTRDGKHYATFATNAFGDLVGIRGRATMWGTDVIVRRAAHATNAEIYAQTRAALAIRLTACELLDSR